MRLEKLLAGMKYGSRKTIKAAIRAGRVMVNDRLPVSENTTVDPETDRILFDGVPVGYKNHVVLMMNKPAGVLSSTYEPKDKTVMDLLDEPYCRLNLNIAGRLDRDTEGLLLLVQDGQTLHQIISPAKGVTKTYAVTLSMPITSLEAIRQGVWIQDGKGEPFLTKPAHVEIMDATHCLVTISEGRFHQVKRMFQAISLEVIALKRVAIGSLSLDPALSLGEYRELTESEIAAIFENPHETR